MTTMIFQPPHPDPVDNARRANETRMRPTKLSCDLEECKSHLPAPATLHGCDIDVIGGGERGWGWTGRPILLTHADGGAMKQECDQPR